ncbi:DUF3397 domain-containing protein [Streptococcaceae bacterium ESL0729]|nr:DUF3397 domain-containing protein [Streptococcaceae bacterium ESL0729]
MILRIFTLLYPLLIIFILNYLFKFFKIRKYIGIRVPDIATLFLILGIYLFSLKLTTTSMLPYFIIMMSGLGIVILLVDLFYVRKFDRSNFFKLFWRLAFLASFIMYYMMAILSLLK